jgi:phage terminase small subunit
MTPTDIRAAAIREAETALDEMGETVANLRTQIDAYGDAMLTAATVRGMWELDGGPVYAVGAHGGLCAHPGLKAMQEAEWHAAKLAAGLNLTPESRARRRVGAPMGSSTATDRRGPSRLRKAA